MSKNKRQCAASVTNHNRYGFYQCPLNATHEEDGIWYCGMHKPSATKARDEAGKMRYAAERESCNIRSEKEKLDAHKLACHDELVAACAAIVGAWEDDEIGKIDEQYIENIRAILAKAKGTP